MIAYKDGKVVREWSHHGERLVYIDPLADALDEANAAQGNLMADVGHLKQALSLRDAVIEGLHAQISGLESDAEQFRSIIDNNKTVIGDLRRAIDRERRIDPQQLLNDIAAANRKLNEPKVVESCHNCRFVCVTSPVKGWTTMQCARHAPGPNGLPAAPGYCGDWERKPPEPVINPFDKTASDALRGPKKHDTSWDTQTR